MNVLSLLTGPLGKVLGVLLLVAGYTFGVYHHGVGVGKAEQAKIDQPKIEAAKNELQDYKNAYAFWQNATELANKVFAQEQAALADSLREQVAKAEDRAKTVKTITVTKEVIRYVSSVADAACTIPVGFVRLFNASIEAHTTGAGLDVPGAAAGGNDAPSGVKLSAVTGVIVSNNAEAVRRGAIIEAWQSWYTQTRANFTKAQQAQAEAIPRN